MFIADLNFRFCKTDEVFNSGRQLNFNRDGQVVYFQELTLEELISLQEAIAALKNDIDVSIEHRLVRHSD